MSDQMSIEKAKKVYRSICAAIESRDWFYDKKEEDLAVMFKVSGDDIPISIIMQVDAERQLVRLLSPLPFNVPDDRRVEGALATCAANYGLVDGNFDYNVTTGQIMFRITTAIRANTVGEGVFQHMIDCTLAVVEEYNDRLLALCNGEISIKDFIENE